MHCAIIGAGAWGTAMAVHLCRLPYVVTLVTQRLEQALELTQQRNNWQYLPDTPLAPHLQITCELQPALMSAEVVFLAVPGKALRDLCTAIRFAIPQTRQLRAFIILSKGLEPDTGLTPCEVVDELLPEYPCAILSGPTFAGETAAGKPAALVCGSTMEEALLHNLQRALNHRLLRIYTSQDRKGVQLGGCLKNAYAIAAGICDGLQLGDNAKAALLTRSLAEMVRLGVKLGGQKETFYGLSGVGDLIATCNGSWSRNRTFGQKIAQGSSPETLTQTTTVEGYRSIPSLVQQSRRLATQAPILAETYAVLYHEKPPQEALETLMAREVKREL